MSIRGPETYPFGEESADNELERLPDVPAAESSPDMLRDSADQLDAALQDLAARAEGLDRDGIVARAEKDSDIPREELERALKDEELSSRIRRLETRKGGFMRRLRAAAFLGLLALAPFEEAVAMEGGRDEEDERTAIAQMQEEAREGLEGRLGNEWVEQWKQLTRYGNKEWFFLLTSPGVEEARLVGIVQGDTRGAEMDGAELERAAEASFQGKKLEVIGIHNHALTLLFEVMLSDEQKDKDWRKLCGIEHMSRDTLERQIEAMRDGDIPFPHIPPSGMDVFNFLGKMSSAFDEEWYRFTGAVADPRGIWEFRVNENKRGGWDFMRIHRAFLEGREGEIPPPLLDQYLNFAGTNGEYNRLQGKILAPYSETAFRAHEAGDNSRMEREAKKKEELLQTMTKKLGNMGITLTFTPYEALDRNLPPAEDVRVASIETGKK